MKLKFKFSIEISRQPACTRHHADDPPEQLAPVTDARTELPRVGWDYDVRSPATAARFGFARPVIARSGDAQPGAAP